MRKSPQLKNVRRDIPKALHTVTVLVRLSTHLIGNDDMHGAFYDKDATARIAGQYVAKACDVLGYDETPSDSPLVLRAAQEVAAILHGSR
jgi:hypothetical protein